LYLTWFALARESSLAVVEKPARQRSSRYLDLACHCLGGGACVGTRHPATANHATAARLVGRGSDKKGSGTLSHAEWEAAEYFVSSESGPPLGLAPWPPALLGGGGGTRAQTGQNQ